MASTFIYLPSLQTQGGGGGGGAVDSVNGFTGTVVLSTSDIAEGSNLYFTNARFDTRFATKTTSDLPEGTNLYSTYANINTALGLPTNSFVFSDGTSQVIGLANWQIDSTTNIGFSNVNTTYQPNNLSNFPVAHNFFVSVDSLQNSPNDGVVALGTVINLDSANSGFSFGTSGDAGHVINGGFNFQGTANPSFGRLRTINMYSALGNGTDPFTVKGFSGASLGANVNANGTLDGSFNGYDFNFNVNSGVTTTSNFSVSGFSDFSQIPVDLYGYQGVIIQPNISKIKNTTNFTGFNLNPTITDLEGNAGFFGVNVGGQITNQGASNGYQGVSVNPTIVHLTQSSTGINVGCQTTDGSANWTGLNISTSGINTTGTVRGIQVTVGPDETAIDSQGHHGLNSQLTLASSLGQTNGNIIGGTIIVPAATAITGTDAFGNNMAFGVDTGDAGSSWTAASIVGLTTLGFVGQITGAGTTTGAINFCLAGFAAAHTGAVDVVNNYFSAAVPTGSGGTIAEHRLFYGDLPGGPVGALNWGVRIDAATADNSFAKNVVVGSSTFLPTNASVGIEIAGTTKAFLKSRLTTTERNALTPVSGMEIYNTTTNQSEDYDNGVWTARSGGGGGSFMATTSVSSIFTDTTLTNQVLYFVDTTGASVNLTLPAPTTSLYIVVKDSGGQANTNNINLVRPGAQNIDGVASDFAFNVTKGSVTIVSDGTDYFLINESKGWGD